MAHHADTLLIVCQVYAPDPAAVGQHVTDVAEECVRRGWRVVVYTASRGYDDPSQRFPMRELRNGVEVRRLAFSSFGKRSIGIRLLAQAIFMAQAVVLGTFTRRLRAVLVSTSPPFAGFGGAIVSWIRRAPLVWWVMDLNPDQMVAAGKLSTRSWATRVFDWINLATLRQARDVIVLDRFMRDRILSKLNVPDKIHVISPWAHVDGHDVTPPRPNAFRTRHGLDDAFVVMYSGNHAIQHPLDTLLDAARHFEHNDAVRFVFIGGGAGKAIVEQRIADGAPNVLSLPFQPRSGLDESLSAADVHVVSMGDDVVGIVHPCKIYGAMAVGRPLLFFGPEKSHVGDILKGHGFGTVIAHGDTPAAIAAITALLSLAPSERSLMGRHAASVLSESFSRQRLLDSVCDAIAGPT
jgi:colanic acid biosynthesis glycosyl transferase WcaI